jgi:hypothetical protein
LQDRAGGMRKSMTKIADNKYSNINFNNQVIIDKNQPAGSNYE